MFAAGRAPEGAFGLQPRGTRAPQSPRGRCAKGQAAPGGIRKDARANAKSGAMLERDSEIARMRLSAAVTVNAAEIISQWRVVT